MTSTVDNTSVSLDNGVKILETFPDNETFTEIFKDKGDNDPVDTVNHFKPDNNPSYNGPYYKVLLKNIPTPAVNEAKLRAWLIDKVDLDVLESTRTALNENRQKKSIALLPELDNMDTGHLIRLKLELKKNKALLDDTNKEYTDILPSDSTIYTNKQDYRDLTDKYGILSGGKRKSRRVRKSKKSRKKCKKSRNNRRNASRRR